MSCIIYDPRLQFEAFLGTRSSSSSFGHRPLPSWAKFGFLSLRPKCAFRIHTGTQLNTDFFRFAWHNLKAITKSIKCA